MKQFLTVRTITQNHVGWRMWPFIAVVIIVVLSVALGFSVVAFAWPDIGKNQWEARLDIVRDAGILIAAIIALFIAGWRGWSADRQAIAAQARADTAQKVLLNDQYQKGAEMLGNNLLAVRLGGIHALGLLAKDSSSDYHIQIIRLLCTFARQPLEGANKEDTDTTSAQESNRDQRPRQDVQEIIWTIGDRSDEQRQLEHVTEERFDLDLRGLDFINGSAEGVDLSGADLRGARLSTANFAAANLSSTRMQNSMLTSATLTNANLFYAQLWNADMQAADLRGASLSGAQLLNVMLASANLSNAELSETDLSSSDLRNANLSGAQLWATDFSGSNLSFVDLSGAMMIGANLRDVILSGARLSRFGRNPVTGLTQKQLDEAEADPNNPPQLDSVTDIQTGRPLTWRCRHTP